LRIDFDRFAACGFDYFREVAHGLAPSLSLLIPLQVIGPFRMVFIISRYEYVVADDLAVSFEDRS
jgi:hypothetical protein